MKVPFHRPSLGSEELAEVAEVLQSGWLTTGPKVDRLEQEFRECCGAPFASAVSSCTAGLHVALTALGIGQGDEVITTPMTFSSSVQAIAQTGATPVLADLAPDGNLDPDAVAARMTSRTRAILPVHLGGLPCQMERIAQLARENDLFVIEDAAHSDPLCAVVPQLSDAAVYSFYATKNMTAGEGGIVTTSSEDLNRRIRRLSLHGMDRETWERESNVRPWQYQVVEPGFKYNLSDLQAAVALAQLRKLPAFREARLRLANYYHSRFADVEEIELPAGHGCTGHAWHLYAIRLNLEYLSVSRDDFMEDLAARGVAASVHFIPIPLHPAFAGLSQDPAADFPQTLSLYPRLVSLPLYPSLTMKQAEFVANTVIATVRANSRLALSRA